MGKSVRLMVLAVLIAVSGILPSHAGWSEYTYVTTDGASVTMFSKGVQTEAGTFAAGYVLLDADGGPVEVVIDDHALPTGVTFPVYIRAGKRSFNGCFADGATRRFNNIGEGAQVHVTFWIIAGTTCNARATVGSLRINGAS